MPVTLVSEHKGRFLVRATGLVTYAESQQLVGELLDHPSLTLASTVLVDAQTVHGVPPTEDLRMIANEMKPLMARGVAGFAIVTSAGFVYGVARMFAIIAELVGVRVSVFREFTDADEWLDHVASERSAPST